MIARRNYQWRFLEDIIRGDFSGYHYILEVELWKHILVDGLGIIGLEGVGHLVLSLCTYCFWQAQDKLSQMIFCQVFLFSQCCCFLVDNILPFCFIHWLHFAGSRNAPATWILEKWITPFLLNFQQIWFWAGFDPNQSNGRFSRTGKSAWCQLLKTCKLNILKTENKSQNKIGRIENEHLNLRRVPYSLFIIMGGKWVCAILAKQCVTRADTCLPWSWCGDTKKQTEVGTVLPFHFGFYIDCFCGKRTRTTMIMKIKLKNMLRVRYFMLCTTERQ